MLETLKPILSTAVWHQEVHEVLLQLLKDKMIVCTSSSGPELANLLKQHAGLDLYGASMAVALLQEGIAALSPELLSMLPDRMKATQQAVAASTPTPQNKFPRCSPKSLQLRNQRSFWMPAHILRCQNLLTYICIICIIQRFLHGTNKGLLASAIDGSQKLYLQN